MFAHTHTQRDLQCKGEMTGQDRACALRLKGDEHDMLGFKGYAHVLKGDEGWQTCLGGGQKWNASE